MDVVTLQRIEENSSNYYFSNINLNEIPIEALTNKTRRHLSNLLNDSKYLLSEEGDFRDWRGVMARLHISNHKFKNISNHHDPMGVILKILENETNIEMKNIGRFQSILGFIDRWDVIDDTADLFLDDARLYLTKKLNQENLSIKESQNTYDSHNIENEEIIVKDDIQSIKLGIPKVTYDAFVLFADEDLEFAQTLVDRMEQNGFKLCIKDRDLVAGIQFEHEAIVHLISERCNRLIIIVSPAFLKSTANKFFVNYAQALGIEQNRNKIIPCLYENCVLPNTLQFYFILNYQRSGVLYNFWDKLNESLEKASIAESNNRLTSRSPQLAIENKRKEIENYNKKDKARKEKLKEIEKKVIDEINNSIQIQQNDVNFLNPNPRIEIHEVIDNLPVPPQTSLRIQSMVDLNTSDELSLDDLSKSSENINQKNNKLEKSSKKSNNRLLSWLNFKKSTSLSQSPKNQQTQTILSESKQKSKKKNIFSIKKKELLKVEC